MNRVAALLIIVASFTLLPTASPAQATTPCVGDCDIDGRVAINELITGVGIALGSQPITVCAAFDTGADATVQVGELVSAVNSNLNGCLAAPALFGEATKLCVGMQPDWIAAADVDGDQIPDLVVVNRDSNDVSVLLGNGDGTFAEEVRYPVGGSPRAAASADYDGDRLHELPDLDGDGDPDIVTANRDDRGLSILSNLGDGTFAEATTIEIPDSRPMAVAAADLDDQPGYDIAVASAAPGDGAVFLYPGLAAGTTQVTGLEPRDLDVVDLDGDTLTDLVVCNLGSNDVWVSRGLGDGEFAPVATVPVGAEPRRLATGDIDGDGFAEIVTANQAGDSVSLIDNDAGSVAAHADTYDAGNNPRGVEIADIDGDGLGDLVIVGRGTDSLRILTGATSGVLALRQIIELPDSDCSGGELNRSRPRGVAIADLDGDDKLDLVSVNSGNDSISILLQR